MASTEPTALASSTTSEIGAGTGKTVIHDSVVSKIAGIAAREVTGVYALGGGAARALGAIRNAISSTDLSQGVSVEVGETQVAVDISLVAEYPIELQKVADDVRFAVITAIESLVGMQVTEVNVTVNDVHIPSDDDSTDPAEARVQ
ncbi:Asp23/Gls24 family envelope stress response protein [Cryobacterium frigoriphilum]|uniref:Asp23/Gls24 family envelope stress response protein n=1 Tax=Cryobacterium frigoriphilum TaxID=1259150 RepID=A0A4R8ZWH5_9MICO|nr:Asp23/Gls24 family envelope stress response protein [Cryobacterium frigoriphilum]TFD47820.1 Asp23/Gls24 family envelope stress response protein [Cryobacterium frigoriphilum]